MPTKISSGEVLAYLNYLGYVNVSAQQLKEFTRDLKKLIKYEERRRSGEHIENTEIPPDRDIFKILHEHGTVASKARTIPKKESVISVQVKRKGKSCPCSILDKENAVPNSGTSSGHKTEDTQTQTDDIKWDTYKKPDAFKSKTSFIRPRMQLVSKSDPVALYQRYQEVWKRTKLPGEDNRAELRWAIREKMLSGPKVTRLR